MYSLVISRTHGRYHNWQLIAKELGHHELNNKHGNVSNIDILPLLLLLMLMIMIITRTRRRTTTARNALYLISVEMEIQVIMIMMKIVIVLRQIMMIDSHHLLHYIQL